MNSIFKKEEKFVNILRINGFEDNCIQEAFYGIKPLTIKIKETFDQFFERIFTLKAELKKIFKIKNLKVTIMGFSLYGFPNNPIKDLKEIPSNIAKYETCDFDFVFIYICIWIDEIVKNTKYKNPENVKNFPYAKEFG